MILEMALYRGVMVWLDGKTSAKSWGCGMEGNVMTSSDLTIDGQRVEKIEVFGPAFDDCYPEEGAYFVFEEALRPETVTVTTDKGTYHGKIDKIVTHDGEQEEPTIVKLESGEDYEIDEITLYLRAILTISGDPATKG